MWPVVSPKIWGRLTMIYLFRMADCGRSVNALGRALCIGFLILVAGCSPADKANRFYEKGMALMQQGELVKARIELQNALQIKENMPEAWYALAQISEKQADYPKMFGMLNKVVDHDPKHLQAHIKLGRLLLAAGKLDRALAASDTTVALAKDNPDVLALRAGVLYKLGDKAGAITQANAALAKDPDNIDALIVLATERLAAKDGSKAIEYLDRGLKSNEKNIALQLIKVQALESLAKLDSAEEIFRKLAAFYPETRALRHILAQFLLSHGRKDAAEAEYRAIAAENPTDVAARLDVVRFVNTLKGQKAAFQELEAMIAKDPASNELTFALASLHRSRKDYKAAEAVYKAIIDKAGDGHQDSIRGKGLLAVALLARGDKPGARALVADVLAKDQHNEQGLLLKAGMAIDEHQLDAAIADLRILLRDVPDSARALLLLAKAHELAGSAELAQEHYLKAFRASKQAAAYGMAYGEFMLKRGQPARAASVAEDILLTSPGDVSALKLLAQAKINLGDWVAAQAVADELRKQGDKGEVSEQISGLIQAGKKNYAQSIAAFKRAFDAAPAEMQPMVSLVRAYLLAGKPNDALTFLNSVIKASPNNINALLLQGQLLVMKGDQAAAAESFKTIINLQPDNPLGYTNLANLHLQSKRLAEADQTIATGLAAVPNDFALRLTQAGAHEVAGRFEDAIKLYEQLLKERPNSDVLANNLASLLSDHRTDKASLSRAYELAQRFKRTNVPQFKDTLGWSSYKIGKANEAAPLIESATKALPEMPVLRYHLGMSYLALNKKDAARTELEKALTLSEGKNFPESEQVKQALKGL